MFKSSVYIKSQASGSSVKELLKTRPSELPKSIAIKYKMKKFISFFLCVFLHVVLSESQNKYTSMYDNIDLNEIVRNERLLKNYVNCLLDEGRCTPDGAELRKNLPDAIDNDCSKCTEKQKEGADFMMQFLIDNKPEYWNRLQEKYDPSGSYRTKYLEAKGRIAEMEKTEEQ